jgi:hypothetical protein
LFIILYVFYKSGEWVWEWVERGPPVAHRGRCDDCREAEEREAVLLSDLREAEAVAAERDVMRVRVTALEDKLNESRTERTQIEHYKQVGRSASVRIGLPRILSRVATSVDALTVVCSPRSCNVRCDDDLVFSW